MLRLFYNLLSLVTMTGDLCHRQNEMTVTAAEGGYGADERQFPAEIPATRPEIEIDYYSQARKALTLRSPFNVADEKTASTSAAAPTLPNSLAAFLNRQSDSRRKRRKKSHSGGNGAEKKKMSSRRDKSCGPGSIWVETEEYFRELALPDIDTLFEGSNSTSRLLSRKCFSIPVAQLENASGLGVVRSENDKWSDEKLSNLATKNEDLNVVISENEKVNDEKLNGIVKNVDSSVVGSENQDRNDEKSNCVVVENGGKAVGIGSVDDKDHDGSDCDVSLEWLLGCRNKASERPLKRRKVLGGDVVLEKISITIPHRNLSYCHYCGKGGTRECNRLIFCASCKVAVHQKCYGVQGDVDGSWLCSWCSERKDDVGETVNPCVLCPNRAGALKRVNRNGDGSGTIQFAHLFCCLWTPEVYVDDLKKIDPVTSMGGIKENRRKLVCNVCKLKYGACVRCSYGTCRTSFHPLCAREARHRMEVWAKYGFDNVELRAFCCKHTDLQEKSNILLPEDSVAAVECEVSKGLPGRLPVNSEQNLEIECKNGSNNGIASNGSPDKLSHNEPEDGGLSDCRLTAQDMLVCNAEQQLSNTGTVGGTSDNANLYDTINFVLVLKKLIERGKVDVKELALEAGISPETLTANINEACFASDEQLKIVNWLKCHVYSNAFQKGLKVKLRPANPSKDENAATNGSDTSLTSDQGLLDPVAVKSVPPRRRTISNIRLLMDNKVIHPSEEVCCENGMPVAKFNLCETDHENPGTSFEISNPEVTVKNLTKSEGAFPEVQGNADKPYKSSLSGCISDDKFIMSLQNDSMLSEQHHPFYSTSEAPDSNLIKRQVTSHYIHPSISNKLLQIHNGMLLEDIICPREEVNSTLEESSRASSCSSDQGQHLTCVDDQVNMEKLVRARKMGVLEYSPEDEMEGELIYFQHRLLQNAGGRKKFADNLISSVAKSLPQEIDTAHRQRWDAVLVNQYLCDLREKKKNGRKEKRHKEAQAVLAAATAAAAASSRVSTFRKDALDEYMQHENLTKLDTLSGRTVTCSQPMPRAKETLSRAAMARISSEKYSDFGVPSSDLSKDHARLCDICRRSETMFNPILICSGCKVVVHLDCYRSVKETTGPWYCELCEDLSSRNAGIPAINSSEKPYVVAECGLCGGTTGAFRKSSNGQWVHSFCAEWVFEFTFRRGQVHAVEGMETLLKGVDICCICSHKLGICIKCSYGHCQTTFHPSCARSAGLYMNARIANKPHHKAYCAKHSSEQRAEAETQKHGIEEFKSMRQARVELERLRLLCERIVKREKLKRELVLCSQDILAFKRDHVAKSVLVNSSFFHPDGSSESATTSLNGNTEGNRSCSETIQRSDDVTVDSSVSARHPVRVAVSMDTDPKMDDDCSTSHSHYNHRIPERMQFSGKRIPYRASAALCNVLDDGGWRSKSRKHAETFGKEIVMTSDEASMKNSMLPKGYAYVPADCLSNNMQSNPEVYASGPCDHAG